MFVLNWLWPRYDEPAKAEQSVMTASGTAWLAAIVGAGVALYKLSNGQELEGAAALVAVGFWTIAGWRIRKFSFAWAAAALVVFALNGVFLVFQRGLGIFGNILVLAFLFAFINGTRATRAYRMLRHQPQPSAIVPTEN